MKRQPYQKAEPDSNAVYQAAMATLEPIVVGLLEGSKKLVIESKPQHYTEGMGFIHTFKVTDNDAN